MCWGILCVMFYYVELETVLRKYTSSLVAVCWQLRSWWWWWCSWCLFVWLMNVVLAVMKSNWESVSVSHEYSNGGLVGSHYLFCQTVKSTIGFILVFIQFNNCMFQAQQMFIGFNNALIIDDDFVAKSRPGLKFTGHLLCVSLLSSTGLWVVNTIQDLSVSTSSLGPWRSDRCSGLWSVPFNLRSPMGQIDFITITCF